MHQVIISASKLSKKQKYSVVLLQNYEFDVCKTREEKQTVCDAAMSILLSV